MSKTVRIEVTTEDIREGEPCSLRSCAIALAVKRQLVGSKPLVDYWVGEQGGADTSKQRGAVRLQNQVLSHGGWASAPMPVEAIIFAKNFDEGKPVEPFSFELTFQ